MKFLHISDLHLGKRVNEFSMIEDQKYILIKILNIVDDEKPDGILIAGDIYDKSVPSEDAMRLWDWFLNMLSNRNIQVFITSGNHDSAVRLSEHSELIKSTGIHLAPVYSGDIMPFSMEDEYGRVNVYMLPFIKPASVRVVFPEHEINNYTDACRLAIDQMMIDTSERNILVAHQFVTGASRCESEEVVVGGIDNVDVSVFDDFDYVALGHIHGPQHIGRETVRYSGTPLKYSFSEISHKKSVTVIELSEKGVIEIRTVSLQPLHDMRQIKGTYEEVTDKRNYDGTDLKDYIHVILTDENDVIDAMSKLRIIYENIMKLSYDNTRTKTNHQLQEDVVLEEKSVIELLDEFYEAQNNQKMSEEQKGFSEDLIQSIWNN